MQKSKDRLVQIQSFHNNLVKSSTRQLKSRFISITSECANHINSCPTSFIKYFVKVWFRAFVGMKDECLVLINGQLIRPYHLKEHENFYHTRGRENSYYKGTKLSACSVDGIDVEYRVFVDQYGHKLGIDAIADQNETMSSSLHDLAHSMDEQTVLIKDALTKRGVKNLKLHIRHKEESLTGTLAKDDDPSATINFSLTREVFEKCQRSVCLSTIVELPPGMVAKQSVSVPVVAASTVVLETSQSNTSSKEAVTANMPRNRLAIYDSDDEKERLDSLAAAERKERQKELELQRQALNFGMDVSLDDIKKSLGAATELLAVVPKQDDDDEEAGVDNGSNEMIVDLSDDSTPIVVEVRRIHIEAEGLCWPTSRTLNVLVLSPVEGTVDSSHSDGVSIGIDISSCLGVIHGKCSGSEGSEEYLDVSEVLDEVCKKLWFTTLLETNDATHLTNMMTRLPVTLIIDKKPYSRGDVVKLPALEGKKYRILCESDKRVTSLLAYLANWLQSEVSKQSLHHIRNRQISDVMEHLTSLVWSQFPLICNICRSLTSDIINLSSSSVESSICEVSENVLEVLLKGAASVTSDTIKVNLSHSCAFSSHIHTILQYCNIVDLTSCGVSHLDLMKASKLWNAQPTESLVTNVNLQYNYSMLSYCDSEWMIRAAVEVSEDTEHRDPWTHFCVTLLSSAASLSVLNVSHCVTTATQATTLCRGLHSALVQRHQKGFTPLSSIVIHGLHKQFPSIVNEFKTNLTDVSGTFQGVVSIDCGGVTRSL